MLEKIEALKKEANRFEIENKEQVELFRLKFLAKKGDLNNLFTAFKNISGEEKKELGQKLNILRTDLENIYNQAKEKFFDNSTSLTNQFDFSLPVEGYKIGSKHPISIVKNEILNIF